MTRVIWIFLIYCLEGYWRCGYFYLVIFYFGFIWSTYSWNQEEYFGLWYWSWNCIFLDLWFYDYLCWFVGKWKDYYVVVIIDQVVSLLYFVS